MHIYYMYSFDILIKRHKNILTERRVPYKFALDAYFQFRCKPVWLVYRRLRFIKIQFNLIRNTHRRARAHTHTAHIFFFLSFFFHETRLRFCEMLILTAPPVPSPIWKETRIEEKTYYGISRSAIVSSDR